MLNRAEMLEEVLNELDTLYDEVGDEEVAFAPGEADEIIEAVTKIKFTAQQIVYRLHRLTNKKRGYDD